MVNKARLKALVRRAVPASLVARYRLHQQSRHVRSNVDVFVEDLASARRWLSVTPDTYRARLSFPAGDPPTAVEEVNNSGVAVDERLRSMAMAAMTDPDLGAVVVAETLPPKIRGMYRTQPEIAPRLIVTRRAHFEEVGGRPEGDRPLPELLARLRSAGVRLGLIPIETQGSPSTPDRQIERDVVVILGMVPMHDVGGGARSTQLALEFLRQGFHVVLVHLFEANESVDLGLRYLHPNFQQLRFSEFDQEQVTKRAARPGWVLVEAPPVELIDQALSFQEQGWQIIYDVIDDWSDPALGGNWYQEDEEADLIRRADRLIASAPDLVERVRIHGRPATLVPNAVNAEVFGIERAPRPPDLPEAEVVLGYHGSLYGDWLDWEALKEVAGAFPEALIAVIGDDKVERIDLPSNVRFLGLKAQIDLPAYVQHFDVGLIPFKVSPTTHAVSPLKVFEYLASGVPVAAPPLRALAGLEGVYVDYDLVPMVRAALDGLRPDRATMLEAHSWAQRVSQIVPVGERHEATTPTAGATVLVRPVIHWAKQERLIR